MVSRKWFVVRQCLYKFILRSPYVMPMKEVSLSDHWVPEWDYVVAWKTYTKFPLSDYALLLLQVHLRNPWSKVVSDREEGIINDVKVLLKFLRRQLWFFIHPSFISQVFFSISYDSSSDDCIYVHSLIRSCLKTQFTCRAHLRCPSDSPTPMNTKKHDAWKFQLT